MTITGGQVALESRGGWVIAHLTGEIDMTNATTVGDELARAVTNDSSGLIVELGGARYLDSAGIGVLFAIARRLRARRQELRIVAPSSSPLVRVLEITEISTAASLHESLEGALGADS